MSFEQVRGEVDTESRSPPDATCSLAEVTFIRSSQRLRYSAAVLKDKRLTAELFVLLLQNSFRNKVSFVKPEKVTATLEKQPSALKKMNNITSVLL